MKTYLDKEFFVNYFYVMWFLCKLWLVMALALVSAPFVWIYEKVTKRHIWA